MLLSAAFPLFGQQPAWRDTLQAAVKMDSRRVEQSLGRLQTGLEGIRQVVSPLGEGDPIRWAQGLPGVATGADGTTAMYVRGGGVGNNLFSLDGVPVYGYSHILGLTTIVPTWAIGGATLLKGGFDGADGNFTASHLRIETRDPKTDRLHTGLALNNFLAGADAEGPVGKRLSFQLSARVSPLAWEYRAFRGMLPGLLGGMDNFAAGVWDAYGKLRLQAGARSAVTASLLASGDRYGFDTPDASHEVMGWKNLVGLLRFRREGVRTDLDVRLSANRYGTGQVQDKQFRETADHLSLQSTLTEYILSGDLKHRLGAYVTLSEGVKLRGTQFEPGQLNERKRRTDVLLATGWLQGELAVPDLLRLKAAVRLNKYRNYDHHSVLSNNSGLVRKGADLTLPELGFSARWDITRHLALEGTYDQTQQYYHTLEGLPVGWSLDMILPTGGYIKGGALLPEEAKQGNVGVTAAFGDHSVSLGAFHKEMKNLVYYKYSQALFSGALASWEDDTILGDGTARGVELLYEYAHRDWYARVAYTLSQNTRHGFVALNEGKPFHARFDRRHMLNATVQWQGLTATLILQSGHWENGEAETYPLPMPGAPDWQAKYYSGCNNYRMPTVFRVDLGWQKRFTALRFAHTLNLAVCNVTNHFNPFMLWFDTRTESWKEIALLPILPNFSWRMEF
ncbi:MAG: TonB-dependent receptor [Bacteroidales bacterium]|nr:TonB-dependent receptor [Bacteroidales bacterium]